MLSISPIPAFADNYIWAIHNDQQCYIVDPGDAAPVEAYLSQHNLNLAGLLITHHHPDHVGGIGPLVGNHKIPVYGPQNKRIKEITHPVSEGDKVMVLAETFTVIDTPGHTLDHIAFYGTPKGQTPALFSGDTLFSGGCGRLFEGTPEQMLQSLDKLSALPEQTRIYCAHEYTQTNLQFATTIEPTNADTKQWLNNVGQLRKANTPTIPSSLGLEKKINPFLRTREPMLIKQIIQNQKIEPANTVAIFAAIRAMKDIF